MSRKPTYLPEYYCPVCGVEYKDNHGCSPSVLRAIDAAHTRANNADFDGEDVNFNIKEPRYADRLSQGFSMVSEESER